LMIYWMMKVMMLNQAALTTMMNPLVWFGSLQVFHLMVLVMLVLIMVLLLIIVLIFHHNQHKMIYQNLVILNWQP
jgi:amino acid permease